MDSPSVSWLHAFPPLALLASTAMTQPVGRLLQTPAAHSVWLRASPLLHALDALGLLIRCLVYCIVLRISPRKALFVIGTERFPAEDAHINGSPNDNDTAVNSGERGTTSRFAAVAKTLGATSIRLIGFGFAVFSLADLAITPGGREARWTAAWGWMYVFAYAILEVATQGYRWELAKPQYTPADFELDEVEARPNSEDATNNNNDAESRGGNDSNGSNDDDVGNASDDSGEWTDNSMSSADTLHPGSELPSKKKRKSKRTHKTTEVGGPQNQGSGSSANEADHEETNNLLSSPSGSGDRDIEAEAGQHRAPTPDEVHRYEYNGDPLAHPRLPALKELLGKLDFTLLHVLGWPVHVLLVYWVFLDLVQPPINQHILAVDFTNETAPWDVVTSWASPLMYLSTPFLLSALLVDMALILGAGLAGFFLFAGINQVILSQMPEALKTCRNGMCSTISTCLSVLFGGMAFLVAFVAGSPIIGGWLFSGHLIWIYMMLSLETVLLVLYFAASFLLYIFIKAFIGATLGFEKKPHPLDNNPLQVLARQRDLEQRNNNTPLADDGVALGAVAAYFSRLIRDAREHLTEEGCALLAAVIITFASSLLWYMSRFQDSTHWLQNWRDALQFINVTAIADNSTLMANTTLANSTAASASSVPQPVFLW
ncbi:hypothetical protein F503_07292 [Ophiostoma piceae UAMH 11346]|uniref:Uncharacterized protein n=1 Tax=Ophiostoma piceae (strain UAMH 11346) TaxID=1262450 RepID=S3CC12_OPHP1|nr:hypothetical protein F503_07292 [Ophiostoma piceae UAMH 11346]